MIIPLKIYVTSCLKDGDYDFFLYAFNS